MEAQKVAVVLFANLVAGQDDNVFGIIAFDKRDVLIDCVRRSLIPVGSGRLLIRRQDMHASN